MISITSIIAKHILLIKPLPPLFFSRSYPGPSTLSPDLLSIARQLGILSSNHNPLATTTAALVRFNPVITQQLLQNRYTHNPLLAAQLYKPVQQQLSNQKINTEHIHEVLIPTIQKALNYIFALESYRHTEEFNQFIVNKIIKKEIISDRDLLQILDNMKAVPQLTDSNKILLRIIKIYFEFNHPTLTIAKSFLNLWNSVNETTNKPNNKQSDKNNPDKEEKIVETLQEKIKVEQDNWALMKTKLNKIQLDDLNNHYKEILPAWLSYLANRKISVLRLTDEEKEIDALLRRIPIQEPIIKTKVPLLLQELKKSSTIPTHLKEFTTDKCYLPEEFMKTKQQIMDILDYLKTNDSLTETDLKLLSLFSSTCVLDDVGSIKFTQKTYTICKQYATELGIQYSNQKPDEQYILNKLKTKDFFVVEDTPDVPPGDILSSSVRLHKTIIIEDETGKDLFIRIGMFTSTQDKKTMQLSATQEINTDPTKRGKKQMYRLFSHFVYVGDDDPVRININATLFAQGFNKEGENVLAKLITEYTQEKDVWSNHFIQESFHITKEVLHKLILIYFEKQLFELEKEFHNLNQKILNCTSEEDRKMFLADQETDKKKALIEKLKQKQYALLSPEEQMLIKAIKVFQQLNDKNTTIVKKEMKKQELNNVFTEKAKEKKEAYLKTKSENNNE